MSSDFLNLLERLVGECVDFLIVGVFCLEDYLSTIEDRAVFAAHFVNGFI